MKDRIFLGLAILASWQSMANAASPPPGFYRLGDLPPSVDPNGDDYGSSVLGISHDGSTIVGSGAATSVGYHGIRWTAELGLESLPEFSSQPFVSSHANGASANGSTIVGFTCDCGTASAFRWTRDEGFRLLDDLPGGGVFGDALGVSADGSVIVGRAHSEFGEEPVRWTAAGVQALDPFPDGRRGGIAFDVSAAGTVIVGASADRAFRWTELEGRQALGSLPGFPHYDDYGQANAISADGSTIVGFVGQEVLFGPTNLRPFRWTVSDGMTVIDPDWRGVARDVSADGSVIVGRAEPALEGSTSSDGVIWRRNGGLWTVADYLASFGYDVAGWEFYEATSVSADGRVIAGIGRAPGALAGEGWVAVAPEPAAVFHCALAAIIISVGWRRRQRRGS